MARKNVVLVIVLLIGLTFSACGGKSTPDVQAIETQTAAKIYATQTAARLPKPRRRSRQLHQKLPLHLSQPPRRELPLHLSQPPRREQLLRHFLLLRRRSPTSAQPSCQVIGHVTITHSHPLSCGIRRLGSR